MHVIFKKSLLLNKNKRKKDRRKKQIFFNIKMKYLPLAKNNNFEVLRCYNLSASSSGNRSIAWWTFW